MKSRLKTRIRKLENRVINDVGVTEETIVEELLAGRSPESIEFLERSCLKIELLWKYGDEFDKQLAAGGIEGVSCSCVKEMDFIDSEVLYALALNLEGKYDQSEIILGEIASFLKAVSTSG